MHARRTEIRFAGTLDGFAEAGARLRSALDAHNLGAASRYDAELVFEEIVANIIRHGAVDGRVPEVRLALEAAPNSLVMTFEDDGVAFDPRGRSAPVRPQSLEQARPGGFGLMLVRRAASSLDYARTAEGRNRLTVTLRCAVGRRSSARS